MSTPDIKAALIDRLSAVQQMLSNGNSAGADDQLGDIIECMLSPMISVTYDFNLLWSASDSFEDLDRPGDCEDASELAAQNLG